MNPRRLLMIAPFFPPRRRVGALRPFKFAKHLQAVGWRPSVVHLSRGTDVATPSEDRILDGLDRLELGVRFDRSQAPGPDAPEGTSPPAPKASSRWLDGFDRMIPIDGWAPWLGWCAPRVLRFAREVHPEVVWSTADPWSSHMLGAWVAKSLGVPWVADFRDPWSLCAVRTRGRPGWTRWIDARVEAGYLERADRVVFTAHRTAARYADAYPRARIEVIENGFDAEPSPFEPDRPFADPLDILFFGRFRPLSSARRIIDVLAALDPRVRARLRVHSVGGLTKEDRARARAAGVTEVFVSEPVIPYEAAAARLRRADILLLSTEPGRDEIIPAKLLDYLPAGRPIFSLGDSPEVADILRSTKTGRQWPSAEAAAAALEGWIASGRVDLDPDPEVIARYGAPAITRRLAAVLDDVAGGRSKLY